MKILALPLILLASAFAATAQVGINTSTPNSHAALDVHQGVSGPQGVLFPRVTSSERLGMTGGLSFADQGLLLFDTDEMSFFWWDGIAWKSLTGQVAANQVNGSNANAPLSLNYNEASLILSDIGQSVVTGSSDPVIHISGVLRLHGSGFVYANVDQLGIVVVNAILQRSTNEAFTENVVDLQSNRCTPYLKISDSRNTSTTTRVIQTGTPCSVAIDYLDQTAETDSAYYYRIMVTSTLSGQQPTAGTVVVTDRSLIVGNYSNQ